ncbi:hypothetical protein M9458_053815, partial [Cirrhinus mrigala]
TSWPPAAQETATKPADLRGAPDTGSPEMMEAALRGTITSAPPLPEEGWDLLCVQSPSTHGSAVPTHSQKEQLSTSLGQVPRDLFLSDAMPPRVRTRSPHSPAWEPGKKAAPPRSRRSTLRQTHPFVRSTPGLVCSHRPEGRLLSRLDFASTQTLSTVCFRGSSGPGASAPQPSGHSGQPREEQTLPSAEDLFSRHGAGLGQYDSLPHQRARAVNAELSEIIQAQNSSPSRNFLEAPGAYGSHSRSNAARPASYETTSALATRSSPEMGMVPWHTPDWCFPAVSPPIQPVVRPCFPTGRSPLRSGLQACCGLHGCLHHGLGCCMQWASSLGLLDGTSTALAHQLPGVASRASRAALLSSDAPPQARACLHRQHCDRSVHQLSGWSTLPSYPTTRPPSAPVESGAAEIAARCSHTRGAQPCSRSALTAAHPPPDSPADLESIRRGPDRSVCLPRMLPLPALLLPQRGSPQQVHTGTQLASGAQVCLSPSEPPCTDPVQDQGGRGAGSAGCAVLAHPDLVCRPHAPRDSPSLEDPLEEGPSFSGDGHHLAPASRSVEPAWVASGRDTVDLSGLPQAVIETITQSRAPSTRQAYALSWGLFVDWCASRGEDPQRCPIAVVLSFLQGKLERRLSPSTLKVYVAAIAAYHDAVDGASIGKHQLVVRFLRDARRVNPPRPHLVPSWDLSVALQGLRGPPFEPLVSVELKFLSLKTALLTALASIKSLLLQAFSVNEACLEFGPADSHVILRPRPGYVPKVPTIPFRDQVVNLQALPPEEADPALALLCPVCALRIYVDRTRSFRRSVQLFVCFGGQQKGNAVSKQRLAHWVVDAISLAYKSQGEPCPLGVRAHSTRSVASSYALAHGASLADICRAAGWATPNTFARFYNLHVEPVSSRVLR